jgi:hypothetical protein
MGGAGGVLTEPHLQKSCFMLPQIQRAFAKDGTHFRRGPEVGSENH